MGGLQFHTAIISRAPLTPSPPPSSAGKAGDLGKDCLSSAVGHALCALPGRVPQPPAATSNAGNPEGMAEQGVLSLITFFAQAKKVIGCGAAPARSFELCRAVPDA